MTSSLPSASGGDARLRVVVVSHTAQPGGAELALERLVHALQSTGHCLSIALLEHGPLEERLSVAGADVSVVKLSPDTLSISRHDVLRHPLRSLPAGLDVLRAAARISRLVRELGVDLVQTNTLKSHVLGLVVKAMTGRPLVWYLHDRLAVDYLPRPVAFILRLLSHVPDAVLTNSASTASTLPRPAHIAYPGFAPRQALPPDEVRTRVGPERPLFLLLGRISPTKGQLEFVEAAARVLAGYPRTRFLIVGDPMFGAERYLHEAQDRARRLGLTEAVTWQPFTLDPTPLLDGATALVHASPVAEPFGQVVLEAAIRGVPVIATRAGGVPEILAANEGGPWGLLVPPGDAASLADAMVRVLEHPAETRDRASQAYEFSVRRFDAATTAGEVEQVWRDVIDRRAGRQGRRPWRSRARTSPAPPAQSG